MGKKKQKYYVVWEGVRPGVYESWAECQAQIKGFPNARYKSFKTREEAEQAFRGSFADYISQSTVSKKEAPRPQDMEGVVWESWSVDAACSGNPGAMEYQCVHTRTRTQIFHQKFELGTNNIGEFLAIVHALALQAKEGTRLPIYSDSQIAIGWVRKGKCKTTLPLNPKTRTLHELIRRAEHWLATHQWDIPLLKWDTERWGEIPADFGRK